jgi:cyclic beta-1,2-glucan synthetase
LNVLERDNVILLGWPALREDTKPYLGRSSQYPEGVRENGMYCHGVQWLVGRRASWRSDSTRQGEKAKAKELPRHRPAAVDEDLPDSRTSRRGKSKSTAASRTSSRPTSSRPSTQGTDDLARLHRRGRVDVRQAMEGVVGASLVKNDVVPAVGPGGAAGGA